jgi:hypothetical protein
VEASKLGAQNERNVRAMEIYGEESDERPGGERLGMGQIATWLSRSESGGSRPVTGIQRLPIPPQFCDKK